MKKLFLLLIFVVFFFSCETRRSEIQKTFVVDYVNPNVGGIGHLLHSTRNLVHLPNGMMRVARDPKGYQMEKISWFPISIMSHRSITAGRIMATQGQPDFHSENWASYYDHDFETTTPYLYEVVLQDYEIDLKLTVNKHSACYGLTFNKKGPGNIYIQNRGNGNVEILTAEQRVTGVDEQDGVKLYYVVEFDTRFSSGGVWQKEIGLAESNSLEGDQVGAIIQFDASSGQTVQMKLGISYISTEQAAKNLKDEIPVWDFDALVEKNKEIWEETLGKIKVEGGTIDQKKAFYTAMYRCHERMVNITEDGKYFSGNDHQVHEDDLSFYVDDWGWDTFLAQHPLQVILNPEEQAKKIQSYVRMYKRTGWMPTFPLMEGERAKMTGNPAAAIIADAYFKGIRGFDIEKAYEGVKKNALEGTLLPWRNGPLTELDSFYHKHGYFPGLKPGEKEWVKDVHWFEGRQAVAITLGFSYNEWCIARLAKALDKPDDYELFTKKAYDYKNLFNPAIGFMAPKSMDGNWIEPFDPRLSGGQGGRAYFTECNGWTYLWHVQHDVEGLVNLFGSRENFIKKLDQLFIEELGTSKYKFWSQFPDATGLVGQFVMGNEPSFHIPYLYNYVGQPWKTQRRIRSLLDLWFTNSPFGICGDEDGGGLSSFYVFSAMGFYPFTPGVPAYTIGSPVFDRVSVDVGNGKEFVVEAVNNSKKNKYIQSVTLNGKPLDKPWFTHDELVGGGVLRMEMGPEPNKTWGTDPGAAPYSMSREME